MTSKSQLDQILSETLDKAPLRVVTNTLLSGAVFSAYGSLTALWQDYPATAGALQGLRRGSALSFAFFCEWPVEYEGMSANDTLSDTIFSDPLGSPSTTATREYLVQPLLALSRPQDVGTHSETVHFHNVGATAIAAAPAGLGFLYFLRGPQKLLRGTATIVLGSVLAQIAVNELDLLRIKTLSWSERRREQMKVMQSDATSAPTHPATPIVGENLTPAQVLEAPRRTFSEYSDEVLTQLLQSTKAFFRSLSPLKKVEGDEYEHLLKKRLQEIVLERQTIENQIDELRKIVDENQKH